MAQVNKIEPVDMIQRKTDMNQRSADKNLLIKEQTPRPES